MGRTLLRFSPSLLRPPPKKKITGHPWPVIGRYLAGLAGLVSHPPTPRGSAKAKGDAVRMGRGVLVLCELAGRSQKSFDARPRGGT